MTLESIDPNPCETFFEKHFTRVEDLKRVNPTSFAVFKKLLLTLSEKHDEDEEAKVGLQQIITIIF